MRVLGKCNSCLPVLLGLAFLTFPPTGRGADVGVPGGLCIQVGGKDLSTVSDLAKTGRFLVHVLEKDAKLIASVRKTWSAQGLYGLASIDKFSGGKLPYTENLVNLAVVQDKSGKDLVQELKRVVAPNGVVLAAPGALTAKELKQAGFVDIREIESGQKWIMARKPWPAEMDEWSHPRHSAGGNAVSKDTIVGPPRRIRWVAGPWQEVANMVTAGGRNYYAGVLARDSFNGLRLWEQRLIPSPSRGGFSFLAKPGSATPVAGDGLLFAFTSGKLQAMDGKTGKSLRTFADAGKPQQILFDGGVLLAVDIASVRAFDAGTGKQLWKRPAKEPRCVVAGGGLVSFVEGNARRGEEVIARGLEARSGKIRWQRHDAKWLATVTRCVLYRGMLAYEVSTLNDDGPGNAIHIISAADGKTKLNHPFLPGMNHKRQARAMFIGDRLWLLEGGKDEKKKRLPTRISAIDYLTGKVHITHKAGLAHCFPPIATPQFLFSGEMDLTDLKTGKVDANRITKAACGRDNGWVPANGLIYLAPKHCVCWPMLRGYAALAAARPGGNPALKSVEALQFILEKGVNPPEPVALDATKSWPSYRHDAWRSGSTTGTGPKQLETVWSIDLANHGGVAGPIKQDWNENPYVNGPITAPVIGGGLVVVARPDAHQVVALDEQTGKERWRFTANGRVDTPPTLHRGLCMFGSKSGWVYCLRLADGKQVWRLRAAPLDERMVAYGGLESPWPVPGSVLVIDDVAYFAAGRQSLADGGILIFAVDPATGARHWVTRLDSVPQKGFYRSSGLEFDNFDLLHREGQSVAMSRWLFNRKTGKMSVEPWKAFARVNTGKASAMVPQGCWSYSPRHQRRTKTHTQKRPLVVFRDNVLFGSSQEKQSIYRRDFNLKTGEKFDTKWITGWTASRNSRGDGEAWRSQRLAKGAKWNVNILKASQTIEALALADDRLYVAGSDGKLRAVSTSDGKVLTERSIPTPLWDGLAVASGRLFVATRDGKLLCLGAN